MIILLFYSQMGTRPKNKIVKFIVKWHLLIEGWRMMDFEILKYLFNFLKMPNCP